jgi:signal transduction histidine kinase
MAATGEPGLTSSPRLVEVVARTLRHEVGDLLQSVYATVAILQDRLAAGQDLEQRLLGDLKARAELCRQELDAVVDLVCPQTPALAPLDLAELAAKLVPAFARRYPALEVRYEVAGPTFVLGDARRLGQVGPMLLTSACQAAQRQVCMRVAPVGGEVEWIVRHDGHGASDEQLSWLTQPFATTHHAQFGLGLALARRVAQLHGGGLTAENLAGGGFRVRMVLPARAAPAPGPA